LSEANIVNM